MKGGELASAHEVAFLRKIFLNTEAAGCLQLPVMLLSVVRCEDSLLTCLESTPAVFATFKF